MSSRGGDTTNGKEKDILIMGLIFKQESIGTDVCVPHLLIMKVQRIQYRNYKYNGQQAIIHYSTACNNWMKAIYSNVSCLQSPWVTIIVYSPFKLFFIVHLRHARKEAQQIEIMASAGWGQPRMIVQSSLNLISRHYRWVFDLKERPILGTMYSIMELFALLLVF